MLHFFFVTSHFCSGDVPRCSRPCCTRSTRSLQSRIFFPSDCSGLKMNGTAVLLNVVWYARLKTRCHVPQDTAARGLYLSKLYWFQSQYNMTQDNWNNTMTSLRVGRSRVRVPPPRYLLLISRLCRNRNSKTVRTCHGAHPHSYSMVTGALSSGVKEA